MDAFAVFFLWSWSHSLSCAIVCLWLAYTWSWPFFSNFSFCQEHMKNSSSQGGFKWNAKLFKVLFLLFLMSNILLGCLQFFRHGVIKYFKVTYNFNKLVNELWLLCSNFCKQIYFKHYAISILSGVNRGKLSYRSSMFKMRSEMPYCIFLSQRLVVGSFGKQWGKLLLLLRRRAQLRQTILNNFDAL